jgi:hypothetical protein
VNLPQLSPGWSAAELIKSLVECFRQLEAADRQNRKAGADVEIGPARLILTDSITGDRVAVSVAAGVVTVTTI